MRPPRMRSAYRPPSNDLPVGESSFSFCSVNFPCVVRYGERLVAPAGVAMAPPGAVDSATWRLSLGGPSIFSAPLC